jgi:hypothetical protein
VLAAYFAPAGDGGAAGDAQRPAQPLGSPAAAAEPAAASGLPISVGEIDPAAVAAAGSETNAPSGLPGQPSESARASLTAGATPQFSPVELPAEMGQLAAVETSEAPVRGAIMLLQRMTGDRLTGGAADIYTQFGDYVTSFELTTGAVEIEFAPGVYKLVQTSAPKGYAPLPTPLWFSVVQGVSFQLAVLDLPVNMDPLSRNTASRIPVSWIPSGATGFELVCPARARFARQTSNSGLRGSLFPWSLICKNAYFDFCIGNRRFLPCEPRRPW